MNARLALVLLAALVVVGGTAALAQAESPQPVPVLAQTVDFSDPASVPPTMIAVFVPAAGDGFSDGGDGPGGLEWVLPDPLPDGFSDGGDLHEGFVGAIAQPVGDDFWRDRVVPDGLVPVLALAWLPGDGYGFSDGGDLPMGFVPVLFPATAGQP
jgi:hypothetical protein